LQTKFLGKGFLLDPKTQCQESVRIGKSNKLSEAFPSNKKLSERKGNITYTKMTQKSYVLYRKE